MISWSNCRHGRKLTAIQDTLDLQNQDNPSAKDHTRQPTTPAPLGSGPAAPHQSQALRHAEKDALNEQATSPRVSQNPNDQGFYDDHDDGEYDGENGTMHDEDGEYGDQEGDEDDMMDKISSSPSIDDGKYTLSPVWPTREASLSSTPPPSVLESSSSPFTSTPEHVPLFWRPENHHQGGYYDNKDEQLIDAPADHGEHRTNGVRTTRSSLALDEFDEEELQKFLLPVDDPWLQYDENEEEMIEEANYDSDDESNSDDDSDSFQFTHDPRFIDSGWGGECLRDIEDIDFEFVYALHTFVATVEGQANATKGDTMVLLDDSNSYWWLVRVVKDGSIGK